MSELSFWHLTWNFPIWIALLYDFFEMGKFHVWTNHLVFDMNIPHFMDTKFGSFWLFFNWGNLMSDAICYMLYGIWHEKSPLGYLWHFLKRFHTWGYFMSDARILYNNWHLTWNFPLWFAGLPFLPSQFLKRGNNQSMAS